VRSEEPRSGRSFALGSDDVTRREVLAASSVALAGCSALDSVGSRYEQSDHELSLDVACADTDAGEHVVRLSWEWTGGDGGTSPADVAIVYWDAEKWDRVEGGVGTTATVEWVGYRTDDQQSAVVFFHDDASADGDTEYAGSVRLSVAGEFEEDVRNVFGKFFHRTGGSADAVDADIPGSYDSEWMNTAESDQEAGSCVGSS